MSTLLTCQSRIAISQLAFCSLTKYGHSSLGALLSAFDNHSLFSPDGLPSADFEKCLWSYCLFDHSLTATWSNWCFPVSPEACRLYDGAGRAQRQPWRTCSQTSVYLHGVKSNFDRPLWTSSKPQRLWSSLMFVYAYFQIFLIVLRHNHLAIQKITKLWSLHFRLQVSFTPRGVSVDRRMIQLPSRLRLTFFRTKFTCYISSLGYRSSPLMSLLFCQTAFFRHRTENRGDTVRTCYFDYSEVPNCVNIWVSCSAFSLPFD